MIQIWNFSPVKIEKLATSLEYLDTSFRNLEGYCQKMNVMLGTHGCYFLQTCRVYNFIDLQSKMADIDYSNDKAINM